MICWQNEKEKKKEEKQSLIKNIAVFVTAGCAFTLLLNIVVPREAPELMNASSMGGQTNMYAQMSAVSVSIDDTTGLLDRQQKQLLENYAKIYAETLKDLSVGDISPLFVGREEGYYKNLIALNLLTEIRKMSRLDLKLEFIQVNYIVESVEQSGSGVTVYLTEDNRQKFKHLSEPLYSYNIYHIFRPEELDGQWFIDEMVRKKIFTCWQVKDGGMLMDLTRPKEQTGHLNF